MPGAVYVNRATFHVEISGLPRPCGGRIVVAAPVPDYRLSMPARMPTPRRRIATRQVKSLSAQAPGVIVIHSPATSGHYIGSPSLAILPNGHHIVSHDSLGANPSHTTEPAAYCNNLTLVSSSDLRNWKAYSPLLYHADTRKHAWQYVDWQFEGDDLVFASRAAFDDSLGGAHTAHDGNYLTFHRIIDSQSLPGPDRLPSGQQQDQSN